MSSLRWQTYLDFTIQKAFLLILLWIVVRIEILCISIKCIWKSQHAIFVIFFIYLWELKAIDKYIPHLQENLISYTI